MKKSTTQMLGKKYGRYTVLSPALPNRPVDLRLICRCECGEVRYVRSGDLKSGRSKSCGCYNREVAKARQYKHGLSDAPIYKLWVEMKRRCLNPKSHAYADYGGRGITVCDRWLAFEHFAADMLPRPEGTSLDRIDNDQGYKPDNCRWATDLEQASNTRSAIKTLFNGQLMSAAQYARARGVSRPMIYYAMERYSLDPEAAADYVIAHRRTKRSG